MAFRNVGFTIGIFLGDCGEFTSGGSTTSILTFSVSNFLRGEASVFSSPLLALVLDSVGLVLTFFVRAGACPSWLPE